MTRNAASPAASTAVMSSGNFKSMDSLPPSMRGRTSPDNGCSSAALIWRSTYSRDGSPHHVARCYHSCTRTGGLMHSTFTRAAVTLALISSLAAAQRPGSRSESLEPIPRELALALMSFGPGMSPNNLLVGRAPDDIPPELIPPGAEILGSVTQFEQRIIVLAVKETPDSAIGTMETRLL